MVIGFLFLIITIYICNWKVSGCWKLIYSTITILGSKRTKLGLRDFVNLGDFLQIIDIAEVWVISCFTQSWANFSFSLEVIYAFLSQISCHILFFYRCCSLVVTYSLNHLFINLTVTLDVQKIVNVAINLKWKE